MLKLYYVLKPILGEENTRSLFVYRIENNEPNNVINTYLYKGDDVPNFTKLEIETYILKEFSLQPDAVKFISL
jgi:hypothetical protein